MPRLLPGKEFCIEFECQMNFRGLEKTWSQILISSRLVLINESLWEISPSVHSNLNERRKKLTTKGSLPPRVVAAVRYANEKLNDEQTSTSFPYHLFS